MKCIELSDEELAVALEALDYYSSQFNGAAAMMGEIMPKRISAVISHVVGVLDDICHKLMHAQQVKVKGRK